MGMHKILIVDDDEKLLKSFKRVLGKHFDITLAQSGELGLEAVRQSGPFAVVISDYKMPGINGLEFLQKAQKIDRDMVRIVLSGYADLQMALHAMNETEVFRLLTKPCDPKVMAKSLLDAIRYHEAIAAEKEMMDQTLRASVGIMSDMLSMLKPEVYSRVMRLLPLVRELAERLGATDDWEIETGTMLSMIGFIALPEKIVEKTCEGVKLTKNEQEIFNGHPAFAAQFISKIPRMEGVSAIVQYQGKHFDGRGIPDDDLHGKDIPLGARILKVAIDYDACQERGMAKGDALTTLLKREGWYDSAVLDALTEYIGEEGQYCVRELFLHGLEPRMVLGEDILARKGTHTIKVLGKGQELTDMAIEYLSRFAQSHSIHEPITVIEALTCSLEDHS